MLSDLPSNAGLCWMDCTALLTPFARTPSPPQLMIEKYLTIWWMDLLSHRLPLYSHYSLVTSWLASF